MANTKNTDKVKKVKPAPEAELPKSIRVKSSTEYVIEVNDECETIAFDMADVTLPDKMVKMVTMLEDLQKEMNDRAGELDSMPNENVNDFLTTGDVESARMYAEFFEKARVAADEFLGKGACQKIFGDKNYFMMFDDLVEQLEPHFKKMGLNLNQIKKKAADKYKNAMSGSSGMMA